jgi:hypothetical protein
MIKHTGVQKGCDLFRRKGTKGGEKKERIRKKKMSR